MLAPFTPSKIFLKIIHETNVIKIEIKIGRKISFIGTSCTLSENKKNIGRMDIRNGCNIKSPLYFNMNTNFQKGKLMLYRQKNSRSCNKK